MTKHCETRRKIKNIPDKKTFLKLLDDSTLTNQEKEMMILRYLDNKSFVAIGMALGYSDTTMKTWHRKALSKLSDIL